MSNLLQLLRRRADGSEGSLWYHALKPARATATTMALWAFLLGFTLDDLHLVRVPLLYVGLAVAVLVYAFAPAVLAARLLSRLRVDAPGEERTRVESAAMRARVTLGVTVAVFVVWLSLFASGQTPRW